MEKIDRRIRRTNRLLQEALVTLTLEKGYDDVTIREITERADVGYATFFRHYPDKDALLTDVLEAMKDEFIGMLQPLSIFTAPEETGALIFGYVQANADLCRVLLNSTETAALLRPLLQIGLQENSERMSRAAGSRVPPEVAITHLMTSLVMMIRWWLDNDMPYPPDQMGRIVAELVIRPVLAAL
jgi:AcrR family transcriptional regulator